LSSDFIGKTDVVKLCKYPEGYTTEVLKQYAQDGSETGSLEIRINRLKKAGKNENLKEETKTEQPEPFQMSQESLNQISKVVADENTEGAEEEYVDKVFRLYD
jgi:hypothetical protein